MRQDALAVRSMVWTELPIRLLVATLLLAISRQATIAREPLAEPPADQTYVGSKECASCHFDQFMEWRTTPHAKGFEILTAKYRADGSCLKCHSTGYGEPTGFKSLQQTPNLAGTTCEACHGPGSKHAEVAKSFGNQKLSKEDEAYVRSTIHLMLPQNVCVQCHMAQRHKQHPPYEK
jgi:hypothetical protein